MATLYATRGNSTSAPLFTINPATAVATQVGTSVGFSCNGLVYDTGGGVLYGATSTTSTSARSLISINTSTGVGTLIGAFGITITVTDLAIDSGGQIYAYTSNTRILYSINKSTGAATAVGTAHLSSVTGGGLAFTGAGQLLLVPQSHTGPTAVPTLGGQYLVTKATGATQLSATRFVNGISGNATAATIDGSGICWGINATGPALVNYDPILGSITNVGTTSANIRALAWDVAPGSTGTVGRAATLMFDGQRSFQAA